MRNKKPLLLAAGGLALLIILIIVVVRIRATGFDRRMSSSAPIGIFLALQDDKNGDALEVSAQMVIFPEQKKVLLLFLNTDACYEGSDKPVRTAFFGEDRFSRFTGIPSSYSIRVTRTNAAR
ncbi:MAG: hypothetical protein HY042_03215, partial [Spirochaetia bacterium]|nr:hypothetical protein [Spirochaetia bacterium]